MNINFLQWIIFRLHELDIRAKPGKPGTSRCITLNLIVSAVCVCGGGGGGGPGVQGGCGGGEGGGVRVRTCVYVVGVAGVCVCVVLCRLAITSLRCFQSVIV